MIAANRYSRFELSPYVCGGYFIHWLGKSGAFMSDVDSYFKKKYNDSWQLIESRALNFLFLINAIEYDTERMMLRLVK